MQLSPQELLVPVGTHNNAVPLPVQWSALAAGVTSRHVSSWRTRRTPARGPSLVLTAVRMGCGSVSAAALRTRRPWGTGHVAFEPPQRSVHGREGQRRVAGEVAEVADAEAPQVLELAAPAVRHW